jgi:hypothetical protein
MLTKRWRAIGSLSILVVLSVFLVPLVVAFWGLDASGAMTHEKYARMIYISRALDSACLALQVAAAWVLYGVLPIRRARYARLLWIVGLCLASIVCTFVCGLLISLLGWPDWDRMAWKLISLNFTRDR